MNFIPEFSHWQHLIKKAFRNPGVYHAWALRPAARGAGAGAYASLFPASRGFNNSSRKPGSTPLITISLSWPSTTAPGGKICA